MIRGMWKKNRNKTTAATARWWISHFPATASTQSWRPWTIATICGNIKARETPNGCIGTQCFAHKKSEKIYVSGCYYYFYFFFFFALAIATFFSFCQEFHFIVFLLKTLHITTHTYTHTVYSCFLHIIFREKRSRCGKIFSRIYSTLLVDRLKFSHFRSTLFLFFFFREAIMRRRMILALLCFFIIFQHHRFGCNNITYH